MAQGIQSFSLFSYSLSLVDSPLISGWQEPLGPIGPRRPQLSASTSVSFVLPMIIGLCLGRFAGISRQCVAFGNSPRGVVS